MRKPLWQTDSVRLQLVSGPFYERPRHCGISSDRRALRGDLSGALLVHGSLSASNTACWCRNAWPSRTRSHDLALKHLKKDGRREWKAEMCSHELANARSTSSPSVAGKTSIDVPRSGND